MLKYCRHHFQLSVKMQWLRKRQFLHITHTVFSKQLCLVDIGGWNCLIYTVSLQCVFKFLLMNLDPLYYLRLPLISLVAKSNPSTVFQHGQVLCGFGFFLCLGVVFVCPSATLSFIFPSHFLFLFLLRDGKSKETAETSHVFSFPELGSQFWCLGGVSWTSGNLQKSLFHLGAICLQWQLSVIVDLCCYQVECCVLGWFSE